MLNRKVARFLNLIIIALQLVVYKFITKKNQIGKSALLIVPLRLGDFCMWLPFAQCQIDFLKQNNKKVFILIPSALQKLANAALLVDGYLINSYPDYLASFCALKKFKKGLATYNFSTIISASIERSFFYNDLPIIYSNANDIYLTKAVNLSERFFRHLPFIMDKLYFKQPFSIVDHLKHPELENNYIFTENIIKAEPIINTLQFKNLPDINLFFNAEFILLVPGSLDISRSWGQHKFKAIISKLLDIYNGKIVIAGAKSEFELGEYLAIANHQRIINYCGKTNLLELAGLIKKSRLVIGNDSGVANLAIILNKKTCVVTGLANERFMLVPERFQDYGLMPPSICRQKPPCPYKGCNFHCHYPNQNKPYRCIESITVDDFAKIIEQELFSE